ncbi:MrcB family domain-containing protein [Chryseobacterium sp. 2R14A]|uniref:MrcB family domain-containing protein n=1 Tax=Chryseobacterium sp. 2R14A TaxID=3380353 RepID=UPI003CE9E875
MKNIFTTTLENYIEEKKKKYQNTEFAVNFKNNFIESISNKIINLDLYKIEGSVGTGRWASIPWIAIFDKLVTGNAQNGYYPVYLFREDMSGFYLSMNQGVTDVLKTYKKKKKEILKIRSQNFRAKVDVRPDFSLKEIDLKVTNNNSIGKLYEYGNIYAKFYAKEDLPDSETLVMDLNYFLGVYQELIFNDNEEIDDFSSNKVFEKKKLKYHYRVERNTGISKKVKQKKGYKCEACHFDFKTKYGKILGNEFIEVHHLIPISSLEPGKIEMNIINDFAVLCSNCHRMIHRLENPSNLEELKEIIKTYK